MPAALAHAVIALARLTRILAEVIEVARSTGLVALCDITSSQKSNRDQVGAKDTGTGNQQGKNAQPISLRPFQPTAQFASGRCASQY